MTEVNHEDIKSQDTHNSLKEEQKDKKTKVDKIAYAREYYRKNKAIIAQRRKLYREKNQSTIAEYAKIYREQNKSVIAARAKEYRKNNQQAIAEYARRWYKKIKNL